MALPAHLNMPGKAGHQSQAGKQCIALAHHLQPQAVPSAVWPGATRHRYYTWRQETEEAQSLPTTFFSASSSQGNVFREARCRGPQGASGWQLREILHAPGTASGLGGGFTAGCPAQEIGAPWGQCRHWGYRSHGSTSIRKMSKLEPFKKAHRYYKARRLFSPAEKTFSLKKQGSRAPHESVLGRLKDSLGTGQITPLVAKEAEQCSCPCISPSCCNVKSPLGPTDAAREPLGTHWAAHHELPPKVLPAWPWDVPTTTCTCIQNSKFCIFLPAHCRPQRIYFVVLCSPQFLSSGASPRTQLHCLSIKMQVEDGALLQTLTW